MTFKLSVDVAINPAGAKSGGVEVVSSVNQIKTAAEAVAPALSSIATATTTSIDTIRSGYGTLDTALTKYKQTVNELKAANAAGKLSSEDLTAALQREKLAYQASTDAIKKRNEAASVQPANDNAAQYRRQNLTYQLFDIGQSAYGGISYTMIAAQQLPQIIQLYAGQGGLNAALRDTAGLLGGVARAFGPVIVAGTALYGVYRLIMSYSAEAKLAVDSTTKALAEQAQPISALTAQMDELTKLQGSYLEVLKGTGLASNASTATVLANIDKEYRAKRDLMELDIKAKDAEIETQKAELATLNLQIRQELAKQVTTNLDLERQGFSDPKIGRFVQLPDSITGLEKTQQLLDKNPLTDKVRRLKDEIDIAEGANDRFKESLGGLGAAASGQINGVNALKDALKELAAIGVPALTQFDQITKTGKEAMAVLRSEASSGVIDEEKRRRLVLAQTQAGRRLENQDPKVQDSDGSWFNVPKPTSRPLIELEGLPGFDKAQKSAQSAADAYKELIKSARDRVDQMKLEADTAGEYGVASDTLRFKLDLLQKSQEHGRSLSPKQVAAINEQVDAFKKYALEAGNAKAKADLIFEREQLGRSSIDQVIANTQRSAGLPIDFDSDLAGMIRLNEQLKQSREIAGDFVDTFFGGIERGRSILQSLGDSGISILKKLGDSLVNNVLNNIFSIKDAASGSGSGGGLLGGLFGGISSLFGGSQYSKAASGKIFGLFDSGGYTGPGGIHEPRGVVHAGEVVFSQADVARHGGVATVEAMRLGLRGYDTGGAVAVSPLLPAARSARSQASVSPLPVVFQMNAVVSGQGDRELQANLQAMTEAMMRNAIDDFQRNILPDRVKEIQNDPFAVG
ncbi:hypothetical protein [Oryzifoliimicrobium ureilyticus]|uniref:hypothetical protein n=1 Tax=Oryzifoliimicrobium ureilyticus TaxID=3113724 RepID=UPI0030764ABE